MKASIDSPSGLRTSRIIDTVAGTSRRLVVTIVLAVATLGIGGGLAFWADLPPSAEATGAAGSEAGAESELPPGWTNAVEECDCLFGGQ